ncbi:uncharacterized protein [Solanum tuberosum]|uniref:uncharacterized protein n=1 Tax=Solanum tuberosum TaxID=4113 RepID=UPI00073A3643|nr:PREDICTED: uncharacterized protein LOC107062511 [Solanum tuberosum]
MAKAKTTSGWRTGWHGAPLVVRDRGAGGVLRGAMRQGPTFRGTSQARKEARRANTKQLEHVRGAIRGATRRWLDSEPPNSITTWDNLAKKFLSRFFPSKKTAKLRGEIINFVQNQGEDMYQAWARFKQMLISCPHHMQTNKVLAHTFFEGLDYNARSLLNSAVGGQALSITSEEFFALLDKLSGRNQGYEGEMSKNPTQKAVGILDVDQATAINAKLDAMQHNITLQIKQIALNQAPINMVQQAANWCEVCGGGTYETEQCEANPDSAQGINQYRSQGVGQQYLNSNQGPNPSAPKGGMTNEELLQKLMTEIETKLNARIDKQDENIRNIQMSQMSLEKQVAQVANSLNLRPLGGLPDVTEPNPKQLHVVSTRSGLQLEELAPKKRDTEVSNKEKKVEEVVKSSNVEVPVPQKKLPPPFPQRLKKQNEDECFGKFLSLLKQVHINLPLVDILQGIPKYAKYVKDIVASKRRLTEYETVALTEKCNSRIQNRLPKKLKDLGSFTVQITIGQTVHTRGLCDLGASINLMPQSLYQKLALGSPKRTTIILQLADRSIVRPEWVVEDVLVQVGSLIFLVDFVVLDFEPDSEVLFILGRSFLATGRVLIDVAAGQLTIRAHDKVEVFDVYRALKLPSIYEELSAITVVDCIVESQVVVPEDPLERVLVGHEIKGDPEAQEIESCLNLALVHTRRNQVESLDRELGAPPKLSIEEASTLELKTLPAHLRYAYLGTNETLPVILSAELYDLQVDAALRILKWRRKDIGWQIVDIHGISPALCMHKIYMEEDHKPKA